MNTGKVDNVLRALVTPNIPASWSPRKRYDVVASLMEALKIDAVTIVATIGLPPETLRPPG